MALPAVIFDGGGTLTRWHPVEPRTPWIAAVGDEELAARFVAAEDDIHGATSAGLRAVLVPHSDIPPEQKGAFEGVPDAVITRLADPLAVVDAWR